MPEDLNDTPYTTYSWQEIAIYAEPEDISQSGDYLYVESEYIDLNEDGSAVTNADVDLRDYPSKMPFILGTNSAGQDLWARIWSGTRTSLWIGFVVAIFEVLIGIIVGIIWGYVRALDRIITEIYNVIDNIPTTIILVLVSYIMRPSISTLIFAMSLTRWLGMARFIRNQIIIIRDRDYNLASRCLGTEPSRIMIKNLLPYLVSVIMLRMALAIPNAIGSEVFITYIGLGLSVSTPSLGNLIIEGKSLITVPGQQYQLIYSSLVLSIITISFYIIGNAFADAADPKNHV
ncbi:MAG: ABC transporter permease [Clostridia bacterium]|nr:ABC transporter permease [Clostridia bacterium]